jgi:hypothetical protein
MKQKRRKTDIGRREQAIEATEAVVSGATYQDAGKMIGVSSERCRQIVIKTLRQSTHPTRYPYVPEQFDYGFGDIRWFREDSQFWLERLAAMGDELGRIKEARSK